jgi:23S rRNA pseudouridine1911/1915/1917 synthase
MLWMPAQLDILYEDNHLLVVDKPAGLPTQGVVEGVSSVVTAAKAYLKRKYHKPGNVYLGVVSRLDQSVSGVLVLARTSKAAARLSEQFRLGTAEKTYWAIVERPPDPPEGELTHWVRKDESQRRMVVLPRPAAGAQKARLAYRILEQRPGGTLVEIRLLTGRKHQIRLQLSAIGCPILGDRKYAGLQAFADGIALHALRLSIAHPISKEALTFEAPLPTSFGSWKQCTQLKSQRGKDSSRG